MAYYQLRLPEELGLDGLLSKAAAEGVLALRGLGLEWPGGKAEAEREMRKVFEKHLSSFDTCGCSSVCDEQVSPAAWNPAADSRLISTTPDDREKVKRFHLRSFHGDLDSLAESTARYLVHAAGLQASPLAPRASKALAEAFESALGPYIFNSQLCKHQEICSSAQPIDPWKL